MSITKAFTNSRLVYSTGSGKTCPGCRQPMSACICKQNAKVVAKSDNVAKVSRSSKGRGGKTVTLVTGLALDAAALAALGKQLKTTCGSGGTVKDGVIEIQGDHCEQVMQALLNHGCIVKRV